MLRRSVEHGLDVTDDIAFADVHGTNEGHIRLVLILFFCDKFLSS